MRDDSVQTGPAPDDAEDHASVAVAPSAESPADDPAAEQAGPGDSSAGGTPEEATPYDAGPPPGAGRNASSRKSLGTTVADRLSWTPRQLRGMSVVLVLVVAVFGWRLAKDRAFVSDPQPDEPPLAAELADRLDPNAAGWQELVAIPTLGEKRAKAIVEYREDWRNRHPDEPAFQNRFDLAKVKGIGPSMIELMSPHLVFPDAPATKPGG